MKSNKFHIIVIALIVTAMLITSCGQPTPLPTIPPVEEIPAETAEEPVEPTAEPAAEEPAAEEVETEGVPPAITTEDRMGIAVGKYPNQYDLAEFEELSGGKMQFSGRAEIDARLVEIFGDIPADVSERLPEEPLVEVPYYEIGKYGGQFEGLSLGPESGNSEFLSVRHANLFRYGEDLQSVVPYIAKDYSINDDLTEFTITLRKGHKWSDGEPFTTDDVLFWYEDILMNKELTPDLPSYWVFGGEPMVIEKVDDVTFVIKTAAPAPGLMFWLASTWIGPFAPRHFLESKHIKYNPDINAEAEAEGFASWVEYFFTWHGEWVDSVHRLGVPRLESYLMVEETTEYQLMVANPYFFAVDTAGQQLPYIDSTRESYSQDAQVLELKIINGEVDAKSQTLSFSSVPVFKQHEADGTYKVSLIEAGSDGINLGFNATHKDPALAEIFSQKEFRYAMSMALDRSEFNKVLCFGECAEISIGVPIHPSASFAKPEWYTYMTEYNVDKANELLDSVGLDKRDSDGWRLRSDGKRLVIFLNYTIQSVSSDAMNLVKSYWEAVGVKVELKEIATEAYRSMVSNNDHDIATFTSGTVLEPMFISNQYRFTPPFGDKVLEPITGLPWAEWMASDGASGIEPSDDVKRLFELTQQFKVSLPGSEEYVKTGQEIGDIHMNNMWLIGVLGSPPSVMITKERLGNFSPMKITSFEFYRFYPYRPNQWFIIE
ncbi:MAG: ABC transporter substrate-binding protein [Anaerolineales bacterium]|nr:ABC transporter substrate-binding protein [Anaerolineales bacterium]